MAARTFVTVSTDGFRDYVDLPDGRQLNLGSVSVLKLVTALVPSYTMCRRALDVFLKESHTTIPVDLVALEELLRPRRSRWAGVGNAFIPSVSRQPSRGASMTQIKEQAQAVSALIDEIEAQIQLLSQTAGEHAQGSQAREQTEGAIASLKRLVADLGKGPMGQSANDAFYFKLASLEDSLRKVTTAGTAAEEDIRAFGMYTAGLAEDLMLKLAEVDETAKDELRLYMENESGLYRQFLSIIDNIKRKMRGGRYDHNQAPKLWLYWVDAGAKAYVREFGGKMQDNFPAPLRKELAKELADDYKTKIEAGEYGEDYKPVAKKASEVGGPAEEVAKDMKVDNPYAGKDQSSNDTYYKLADELMPSKEATEGGGEVGGPAEEVAKDMKVDNPYAGKDQSKNDTYYKLAATEVPFINEALSHSVMAKVEAALRVVEASSKQGVDVAKSDLSTITTKLTTLLQASELGDPGLCSPLRELAGLADKVHAHFAS